jgi:hypothetical protein
MAPLICAWVGEATTIMLSASQILDKRILILPCSEHS